VPGVALVAIAEAAREVVLAPIGRLAGVQETAVVDVAQTALEAEMYPAAGAVTRMHSEGAPKATAVRVLAPAEVVARPARDPGAAGAVAVAEEEAAVAGAGRGFWSESICAGAHNAIFI
jgi:hypothetical protein